jgi:hypothetical protein
MLETLRLQLFSTNPNYKYKNSYHHSLPTHLGHNRLIDMALDDKIYLGIFEIF